MSNRLESNDGWKRAKMSKLGAAVADRRYSCFAAKHGSTLASSDLIIHLDRGGAFTFAEHPHLDSFKDDQGMGRHAGGEKHVAADGAAFANHRLPAQDGSARINGDPIFDGRMPFATSQFFHGAG